MRDKAENKAANALLTRLGYSEFSSKIDVQNAALRCRDLGFSAFQIAGDFPINFPENIEPEKREKVYEFIKANRLNLHFHAPTDIPLASRHAKLRLAGIERLDEYMALAIDMGAQSFIFHPGRFAYYKIDSGKIIMAGRDIPDIYSERFLDSVKRLIDFNAGRLKLLLENTYNFSAKLIEIVDRFLSMPSTGLAWDIGHMNKMAAGENSNRDDTNNVADFFAKRTGHIKLAHIHDIAKGKGHLPLGAGVLDIRTFIEIIRKLDIDIIIEVFSEQDLKSSIKHLESLLSEA